MSSPFSPGGNTIFSSGSAPGTPRWEQSGSYGPGYHDPYTPTTAVDLSNEPLLPKETEYSGESLYPPPLTPVRSPQDGQQTHRYGKRPSHIPLVHSNFEPKYSRRVSDFDPSLLYNSGPPTASDSFLKTPEISLLPYRPSMKRRRHPFSQSFEAPDYTRILIHVVLCGVMYAVLMGFVAAAQNKSLFWTRVIVGFGCGTVGFALGYSLIELGKPFLEAATWATLIHQSRASDKSGIRLKDFADAAKDSSTALAGIRLFYQRWKYDGTLRESRSRYDTRYWSMYVIFFIILVGGAPAIAFWLGRIVDIDTRVVHQSIHYSEVLVKGDLSSDDIEKAKALQPVFNDFRITWTIAPFSTHGGLPPPISFPWHDDKVYFSETIRSQLLPNGSGFGTFDANTTAPSIDTKNSTSSGNTDWATLETVSPGQVVRYPRWGIRIHCRKIPDGERNIIPRSQNNKTYILYPRSTVQELFDSFQLPTPEVLDRPLNTTKYVEAGDVLPTDVDLDSIAIAAFFYDNGVAHSLKSTPLSMGAEGTGFVALESVLVRLNTSFTPEGKFPRYSDEAVPDATGAPTRIGYDAAVCLELYEPWVVETYNSTAGPPSSMKIVSKNAFVQNLRSEESIVGEGLGRVPDRLNSSNLAPVYDVAHGNSVNQILKDNGRDAFYVPSPTIVSFTSGQGPQGYTELSEEFFAQARALADASNVLPYLAGTGDILARSFPDHVLSNASIRHIILGPFLAAVLLIGLVAGFFVPRLPLGVPKRGFELYSWMAAFQGDEITSEMQRSGAAKNMEVKEIEKSLRDSKLRYVF